MCKKCEQDPYLAGTVVYFMWTTASVETGVIGEDGSYPKTITVEETRGPYTGRCVRHHRGWVVLRTAKGLDFTFPPAKAETHLLAYLDA